THEKTFGIVNLLQNKIGLTTMAHYTCVNATREKVGHDLIALHELGIENLMLLRGDPPKGMTEFVPASDQFQHGSDLVKFAHTYNNFSIGAAAYVEGHPESISKEEDLKYTKLKVDNGADFLITQLFFDNSFYFDYVKKAREIGIECRIIPGIIPITNFGQIKRFIDMSNATIPPEIYNAMEPYKDKPKKTYELGVDFAIKQVMDLLANGAPGIHFYTLNKSRATVDIYETLKSFNRI
ncbi:methylenetetrahydrofolate reductase, partial [Bacteroidota bacterium]